MTTAPDPAHVADLSARVLSLADRKPVRLATGPTVDPDDLDDPALLQHARARATQRWEATVPARYRDATSSGLDHVARADVDRWSSTWLDRRGVDVPNLVLVGPAGTGKTWAAAAAARPIVEAGHPVLFVSTADLLDDARDRTAPTASIERSAGAVDLLVLDDLGAERLTEWGAERLLIIADRRWRTTRATIVTTNLEPRDLAAAIGPRIYSRWIAGSVAVRLSGPDRRRRPDPYQTGGTP